MREREGERERESESERERERPEMLGRESVVDELCRQFAGG
jgi:hypothetical protein